MDYVFGILVLIMAAGAENDGRGRKGREKKFVVVVGTTAMGGGSAGGLFG